MPKCPVCGSRKGKRLCQVQHASICPPCCASIREESRCATCIFYQVPRRDYGHLERYSVAEMDASGRLALISHPIEHSLCVLDRESGLSLRDEDAIAIMELLLDRYAFGDSRAALADRIRELGCGGVFDRVEQELAKIPSAEITKVLGAVRHVARRRARGGRDHMEVLHKFVGQDKTSRVGRGILDLMDT